MCIYQRFYQQDVPEELEKYYEKLLNLKRIVFIKMDDLKNEDNRRGQNSKPSNEEENYE